MVLGEIGKGGREVVISNNNDNDELLDTSLQCINMFTGTYK